MNQDPINNIGPEPVASEPVAPGPTTSEPVVTEQVTVTETGPVFKTEEPKKGKGMLLGLVFCLILAIGGIGFGVWAMMDGNARADKLNKQISSLQAQNAELAEQLAKKEEGGDDAVFWPAEIIHSDKKIYVVNESDKVVASLEAPVTSIKEIVGCSQAVSGDDFSEEEELSDILVCAASSDTGEEFGFSYNTVDGTIELKTDD